MSDAIKKVIQKTTTLHATIGEAISNGPHRDWVRCGECGHYEKVNAGECIKQGWPKHCGYTMSFETRKR